MRGDLLGGAALNRTPFGLIPAWAQTIGHYTTWCNYFVYTHLELSSQWKLIRLKRRKKRRPSNFRCAKFSVCVRNKCVCRCMCV